jgi:hypothetical protein
MRRFIYLGLYNAFITVCGYYTEDEYEFEGFSDKADF